MSRIAITVTFLLLAISVNAEESSESFSAPPSNKLTLNASLRANLFSAVGSSDSRTESLFGMSPGLSFGYKVMEDFRLFVGIESASRGGRMVGLANVPSANFIDFPFGMQWEAPGVFGNSVDTYFRLGAILFHPLSDLRVPTARVAYAENAVGLYSEIGFLVPISKDLKIGANFWTKGGLMTSPFRANLSRVKNFLDLGLGFVAVTEL